MGFSVQTSTSASYKTPNIFTDLLKEIEARLADGEGMAALRCSEKGVDKFPEFAGAWEIHGKVLEIVGRHEEALLAYRKAGGLGTSDSILQRVAVLEAALESGPPIEIRDAERSWRSGLPFEVLTSIQKALHRHAYRGVPLLKNPFDLAIYSLAIWEMRPGTIIEIGSKEGGSAIWMAELLDTYGFKAHVHSIDIVRPKGVRHRKITFHEADGRNLSTLLNPKFLARCPKPWLVIEDADHTYETSSKVLSFFEHQLEARDLLVIEDGIVSDLSQMEAGSSGPHRAIAEFLDRNWAEWKIESKWCDYFGYNYTWNTNGWLKRGACSRWDADFAPELQEIVASAKAGKVSQAQNQLAGLKSAGFRGAGTDYLRAICFDLEGRPHDALEAAREELRWHPGQTFAKTLADRLSAKLHPPPTLGGDEFKGIYKAIRPYTMLSEARLHSLYELARRVCDLDIPGDFVECGVAGGGSCALLATVIDRHSKRPRRLYACDTFSGMPAPTAKDVHGTLQAPDSGWGKGTCSAPTASLTEVCALLGVEQFVQAIPGLFAETLPRLSSALDRIGFLHMDGDWYDSTHDILVNLNTKLSPHSLIQVDDYGYWQGCRDAIHDFEKANSLHFRLHDIDGTGAWFARPVHRNEPGFLVNLGCGTHYHTGWLNFDLNPTDSRVIACDIRETIPLDDSSCSIVYHSHVLEHLTHENGLRFLAECLRILKPGGILRLVVPDLEQTTRAYLRWLEEADSGDCDAVEKHGWMTMELVDQLSRHQCGGEILKLWSQPSISQESFIVERMGVEAESAINVLRRCTELPADSAPQTDPLLVGKFRLGGEPHLSMYDRISLRHLLVRAGFVQVQVCGALESGFEEFPKFLLDTDQNGRIRKPDSLFMEARRKSD